jgi:hypothetical protein
MFIRDAAAGDYRIVAAMPDRDGEHIYRIKSPLEEHERVVQECLLIKSEGFLPEEIRPQKACSRGITLPRLSGVLSLMPDEDAEPQRYRRLS